MKFIILSVLFAIGFSATVSNSCHGLSWFKCSSIVANCYSFCSKSIYVRSCYDCMGTDYEDCSKCFTEPPIKLNAIGKNNFVVAPNKQLPNGCSGGDFFRCAGIVADCWQQCDGDIFTKNCMNCCGDAWDQCSKCFENKKM